MTKSVSCSMENLLNYLSGTWTTYILWFLHRDGALRFGELRRKIGDISTKVLTQRLRMMESMGIVYRHYEPTIPPQVTYGLTERGKELTKALTPLYKLALRWNA
ncbi:winged helix-turn-helix transcriptional regulator [Fischerella sp. PCC 9605]|uniref:winged helix-turn-helix transcriptional regulator n=1 Tax=Fischerella sp. PCC 9605 TaxID=1173024 RepID=UPI00047A57C4|nr:helix-turn-helix domain-containing protein [Fischerella sp. PCC 9605]